MGYIGRFAPSPTGSLHFGSLIAAMGSFLQAKTANGIWLVRIEDLDKPREQPGAADSILHTLDHHGFQWDGVVSYQSQHSERYEYYLDKLKQNKEVYACECTRRKIIQNCIGENKNPIYPGTCRDQNLTFSEGRAVRLNVDKNAIVQFSDQIQGKYSQNIGAEVGDFNLIRRDGLYAYQLAVVVDDAEQCISEVVRGTDLIDNTPRQIYLQERLGLSTPKYLHLPIALNKAGDKLSKQTFTEELKNSEHLDQLVSAWKFLNPHLVVEDIEPENCNDFWQYALSNWNIRHIPTSRLGYKIPAN